MIRQTHPPGQPVDSYLSLGLALGLGSLLAAGLDALKDGLTVLVELELGDDHVGGVDAERDGLAGGLLTGDALDVDHVLEAVDRGDLALLLLVEATDDHDLVVLADGDASDLGTSANCCELDADIAYVVLLAKLLAERGAHDVAADAGRSTEVLLARLAPGGVEGCDVVN